MSAICPLLGRPTETEPTPYERHGFRLVRCLETDFIYMENPPAYDELRDDFPWEKTIKAERNRRKTDEPIFSRLSDAVKRLRRIISPRRNQAYQLAKRAVAQQPKETTLRLLDVGCGSGLIAADCCQRFTASGRTVKPIGLELSKRLAKYATKRFAPWSGEVIAAPALKGLNKVRDRSVDVATLISFLEHDTKPLDLLVALRPKLSRNGAAIVKVPNYASLNRRIRGKRWCGFRFPDHVNYFTPQTMRRLAEEAGYTVDHSSTPLFGDNMYVVLRPAA
jgi:SAM-dependent methyltransferase